MFPHDKVFALPQAAFSILILAYLELKTPLPAFSTQSVSEEDTFGSENHVCSGSRRRKKYLHQAILFENGNVENLHPEQPLSLKMQVELRCQSTCLNCGLHASSPASRHTSANEGCRALQPCPIPPTAAPHLEIHSQTNQPSSPPHQRPLPRPRLFLQRDGSLQLSWTALLSASPKRESLAWWAACCMEITRRPCHAMLCSPCKLPPPSAGVLAQPHMSLDR